MNVLFYREKEVFVERPGKRSLVVDVDLGTWIEIPPERGPALRDYIATLVVTPPPEQPGPLWSDVIPPWMETRAMEIAAQYEADHPYT